MNKAKKPKVIRGKTPTLTGNPPLGYLNGCYCPVCNRLLFSYYDADVLPNREDGFCFSISEDWNYCSKCGTLLDLSVWKRKIDRKKMLSAGMVIGGEEEIEFDMS